MKRPLSQKSGIVRGSLLLLILFSAAATGFAQTATARSPSSKLFNAKALLEDIKNLSADSMEGRSADRASMKLARDYVLRRFKESGMTPIAGNFEQEFTITRRRTNETFPGVNFVGSIKGKKYPDKVIVVSAHYDHVGVRNNEIYNGADDNASGTSALFAIASYFKEHAPDHTLIFAAFDAEEMGLQGSRYFVANPPVSKDGIILNINLDMVSRNEKGELYAAGAFAYPHLRPILEEVQKTAPVKLMIGHDDPKLGRDNWTNQSDQGSFNAAKIPFVYFGVEDHPDYHKPTDDFANIMPDFYVRAVETVLSTVRLMDKRLTEK